MSWQPQQGVAINAVAYNVVQGAQWIASASIRLTKLKLSASMYARQLWADASIIERGTAYTRKKGSGVLLAVSYPR